MADYDTPTCIRCDSAVALAITRAGITLPVAPAERVLRPCGTHAAFVRHKLRDEPIDHPCRLGERAFQAAHKRAWRARKRAAA